jgi:hypothetical protein
MSRTQLRVLCLARQRADTHLVVRAATWEDRYFPPLLAAQLFLDVRGLVGQSCYSKLGLGKSRRAQRWTLAQEIYSNQGRGTEAGHFLEHLLLEVLTQAHPGAERLSAETTWDFTREPDVFRIRFRKIPQGSVEHALAQGAEILGRRQYHLALP